MNDTNASQTSSFVLVTGATSGIGLELARVFARNGFNLVLVARNEERLSTVSQELQEKYRIRSLYFKTDLSDPPQVDQLYQEIVRAGLQVSILVNNAGFGYWGYYQNMDPQAQIRMVNVNITALVHLTRLFLPDMIRSGSGRILNVSSMAAFRPMALLSTYAATKTFVLYFSRGLNVELEGTGVSVSVLCPPHVKTGFQKVAGNADFEPPAFMCNGAEAVAAHAYKQLMQGRLVIRPWSLPFRIVAFILDLLPSDFVTRRMFSRNRISLLARP